MALQLAEAKINAPHACQEYRECKKGKSPHPAETCDDDHKHYQVKPEYQSVKSEVERFHLN